MFAFKSVYLYMFFIVSFFAEDNSNERNGEKDLEKKVAVDKKTVDNNFELGQIQGEIDKLCLEFNIAQKKKEYDSYVKIKQQIKDLRSKFAEFLVENDLQDLIISVKNKEEELKEKTNVKKIEEERKRKSDMDKYQKDIEFMSLQLKFLELSVNLKMKKHEISKFSDKDLDFVHDNRKEIKLLQLKKEKIDLLKSIKEIEYSLVDFENIKDEDVKKMSKMKKEIEEARIEIERIEALETLDKLKKKEKEEYKKEKEIKDKNFQKAELNKSEKDLILSEIDLKNTKDIAAEIERNDELRKIRIDSEKLRLQNENLSMQIENFNKKDELFKKIQKSRNYLSHNPVQYLNEKELKEHLKKTGVLVLSDRQIKFGLIVDNEEVSKAELLINFYNNDIEHRGYPIFLIFERGCHGGYVSSMTRLINTMMKSKSPVYVVVKQFAYSAAAIITTCAVESFIYPEAVMLHHQMQSFYFGYKNTSKWLDNAKFIEKYQRKTWERMLKKIGISYENFIKKMYENSCDGEGWRLLGEEAKKEKWVNNVIESCYDTSIINKECISDVSSSLDLLSLKKRVDEDMKNGHIWYIDKKLFENKI